MSAELARKLAAHNKKHGKKAKYEPRKHSMRDVRWWEAKNGKKWAELSRRARVEANAEITAMVAERNNK